MERLEMMLPRKFCRRWDLRFGSRIVCVVYAAICFICIIAASVYLVELDKRDSNDTAVMRNSYAITLVAIIFCIIFLLASLALYRAIARNDRPMMLSWVLIGIIWWAQAFLLCMIVIFMYRTNTSCGLWLFYLLLGLLAFMIMAYGIAVVFAYWRQMQILANQQYQPRQWKPPAPGVPVAAPTPAMFPIGPAAPAMFPAGPAAPATFPAGAAAPARP